ncbi:hypothetical protein BDZ85DRAFT_283150 [Elsinoe ampelina]|uniref:Uncharacterized protein n=1 Tax=Elsinoe ampelina TaxID=302913 RepID=A0A6A6G8Y7_9PEZI|nr:hypothetical protein BDZ85DRAFT_283150 [Elsinoe ampelina]
MSSPSEFLTFYRRMAAPSALKRARVLPRPSLPARAITYTATRSDIGHDKKHTTDKKDRLDVQSNNSFAARDAKAKNEGGAATQQKDERGGKQMAKDENPEMPDGVAAIGFQDERGAKPK